MQPWKSLVAYSAVSESIVETMKSIGCSLLDELDGLDFCSFASFTVIHWAGDEVMQVCDKLLSASDCVSL